MNARAQLGFLEEFWLLDGGSARYAGNRLVETTEQQTGAENASTFVLLADLLLVKNQFGQKPVVVRAGSRVRRMASPLEGREITGGTK